MHKLAESRLLAGNIYGDARTGEYIYLPGSELDADEPMLVYENKDGAGTFPWKKHWIS